MHILFCFSEKADGEMPSQGNGFPCGYTAGCFYKGTEAYLTGYFPPYLSIGKHDGLYTCIRPPTRLPLYTCASIYGAISLCPFSFLLPYPWLPVQIGTNRCLDLGKSVSPPTGEHLSDRANIDVLQANFTPLFISAYL